MSGIIQPVAKNHIPEKCVLQIHHCKDLKKKNLTALTALCNRSVVCFLGGGN